MAKKIKQFTALATMLFIGQMLFPQFSQAHAMNNGDIQKGLEETNKSVILIKNSPQPVLSDAGSGKNMTFTPKSDGKIAVQPIDAINDKSIPTAEEVRTYVLNEAKKAGLDPHEVDLIVKCESTWNPNATHINKNGSIDAGLWQINSIHKSLTLDEKKDYKVSTKWAINKRLSDGNWSAWSCAKRMGIN